MKFEGNFAGLIIFLILAFLAMPFPLWLGWACLRYAIPELPMLTYKASFFITTGLWLIAGTVIPIIKSGLN